MKARATIKLKFTRNGGVSRKEHEAVVKELEGYRTIIENVSAILKIDYGRRELK